MTIQTKPNSISIGVNNLLDLILDNSNFTFSIPDYQRPYVWEENKIKILFNDIKEELSNNEQKSYYMGAILLHHKEGNVLEMIDGQQRITTLLILDFVFNGDISIIKTHFNQLQLFYNFSLSKDNIRRNKEFVYKNKDFLLGNIQPGEILQKLIFTVIVTQSQDDAFVFFDTQNNRGVKLSAVDFLKSYHLKALKGEAEEIYKQREAALSWDNANQNQCLDKLFNLYLWRGRAWKGKDVDYESKDKVLWEFQRKTKCKPLDNSITLYANNNNKLASSIQFSAPEMDWIKVLTQKPSLLANPVKYPFTFRQPIEKGMGFFLFTQKYYSLYKHIFNTDHENGTELLKVKEFYITVYLHSGFSRYFRNVFKLCLMLYYDKFEDHRLLDFSLWLDYLLGAYRIKQKSIVAQTPVKILKENTQNLLDVIERAYLPDEIFEFIETITDEGFYQISIGTGNGVRENYKRQVYKYYAKEGNSESTNKKTWINAKLQNKS